MFRLQTVERNIFKSENWSVMKTAPAVYGGVWGGVGLVLTMTETVAARCRCEIFHSQAFK